MIATQSPIAFGTDGWRAVIAKEFTFDNVRKVAQALCNVLKEDGSRAPLIVGFDTRFLSDSFAREAAQVAVENGFRVLLADRPCSSPSISWAVKEHEAQGAVMITASHNPPTYNGFKIKAHYAGSADPAFTKRVEEALSRLGRIGGDETGTLDRFDPREGYFRQLGRLVDREAIAQAGLGVVADPMYGAGSGYLSSLLAPYGMAIREIHAERNPSFGGTNPEPITPNLAELQDEVRKLAAKHPLAVGLAFDGDADRIGAVDATGSFVNSHQILALILQHLVAHKGWRGGVIRTFSTSTLVEKLAKRHGLQLFETPIGFKYICELMRNEDVLIGGEESGGIGIKNHIPERDGILCGLLLLEIMAVNGATLGELVGRLESEFGPHRYDRIDLHLADNSQKDRVLAKLKSDPPSEFAGARVLEVQTLDGVKLVLEDGWILFRASGTEPLLRVYTEAPSDEQVAARLAEGRSIALG